MREKKVEVKNLIKRYGKRTILDNLSFSIEKGTIFGIFGSNGAGKSTFISILAGICIPDSGDVLVDGASVIRDPTAARASVGYVPQDIALYDALSARDNLGFWAGIYGLKGKLARERVDEALSIAKLEDRAKDRVASFSGGMKRRLNVAVSLLHHPDLMVMDEPTAGVDIQSRRYMLEAFKRLRDEGRTIVITSHQADEMEILCDGMAILENGIIKGMGTPEELKRRFGKVSVEEILIG